MISECTPSLPGTDHRLTRRQAGKPGEFLTELGVRRDGSLSVLQSLRKGCQLGVRVRSIIVSPGIIRVPLDTLRVSPNSTSEITILEQSVPFLSGLSRFLRIDVCQLLGLGLGTFGLTEFVEDIWGSVFCERLVKILDGGSQVPGLSIGGSNSPVGLCDELVVRPDLGRQRGWHT